MGLVDVVLAAMPRVDRVKACDDDDGADGDGDGDDDLVDAAFRVKS